MAETSFFRGNVFCSGCVMWGIEKKKNRAAPAHLCAYHVAIFDETVGEKLCNCCDDCTAACDREAMKYLKRTA